jgi:hypothetical protein
MLESQHVSWLPKAVAFLSPLSRTAFCGSLLHQRVRLITLSGVPVYRRCDGMAEGEPLASSARVIFFDGRKDAQTGASGATSSKERGHAAR